MRDWRKTSVGERALNPESVVYLDSEDAFSSGGNPMVYTEHKHTEFQTRGIKMIQDSFDTINESHEFSICENGYTLRVSGRDSEDNWITKTYVYTGMVELFDGIRELTTITVVA
jgi:hypothetical protein